ncbi:MAG: zinc ABC transporter substrate-binding protein [Dehalococcoidales bacterium]|nr:zinc ABC transporter substrate-binding protein [Dehalococcoidales bacterium]
MKKLLLIMLVPVILCSFLSCTPDVADSDKPTIVVTYSILGSVVKDLVGDRANVIVSIPNGLDPHAWEPSAKDIEVVNKADLVIRNGLSLEVGMEKTLELAQTAGVKLFTASDYITVRYVGPGEGIPYDDPDQTIGAPDPHLWMDPLAMKSIVAGLVTVLKYNLDLDVSVEANALANRLDELNVQVADILAVIPQDNRKLVTGHESMGYFAGRYGFTLTGVIIPSLSSQAEVSASDMAALKKAIEDNGVKAIFTELGTSAAVAEAIARETGVQVIELAAPVLPEDGSYFTFLTGIAETIAEALK